MSEVSESSDCHVVAVDREDALRRLVVFSREGETYVGVELRRPATTGGTYVRAVMQISVTDSTESRLELVAELAVALGVIESWEDVLDVLAYDKAKAEDDGVRIPFDERWHQDPG